MARYFCVHPGHEDDGIMNSVNVTAQVRLERALFPRTSTYLAITDDVVAAVTALSPSDPTDRIKEVYRILTGDPRPQNGEVIMVPRGRVEREAGLYETDDLRAAEPAVDRLIRRFEESTDPADGPDEMVVLRDDGGAGEYRASLSVGQEPSAAVQSFVRAEPGWPPPSAGRANTTPEGVFSVWELGQRLAAAPANEVALLDAIRDTGLYRGPRPDPEAEDWRVLIECPVPTGEPASRHKVIFTGRGDIEPTTVYGLPLAGREQLLEDAANTELAPAAAIRRADWRLRAVLVGEIAVLLALGVAGWLGGALGFSLREAPWALALATALAIASVATAVLTLTDPPVIEGNGNDLFTIRTALNERIDHLATTSWISTTLFALALFFAVVAPIWAAGRGPASIPSPAITFDASGSPIVATVRFLAGDVASGETIWVDMTSFDAGGIGTHVGSLSATGDSEGRVRVDAPVSVNGAARYLAVRVWLDDDEAPTCTPTSNGGPGCAVVVVPRDVPAVAASPPPTDGPGTATSTPSATATASATQAPSPVLSAAAPIPPQTASFSP